MDENIQKYIVMWGNYEKDIDFNKYFVNCMYTDCFIYGKQVN